MAIEVQAPNSFTRYIGAPQYITMFAGGSIEMNAASLWQKRLIAAFRDYNEVVILNPRRDAWDSSWNRTKNSKNFRQQVKWERFGLEECDLAFMYFDPATKSPISLYELGRYGRREDDFNMPKMHVICPPGFWRKGNVDIACEDDNIPMYPSLGAAIKFVKANLDKYRHGPSQVSKGILR